MERENFIASNRSEEEASRKAYEVSIPLDNYIVPHHLKKNDFNPAEDKTETDVHSDDQDDEGRPKCNIWNGENHELHVLGSFDNDFQKHLKRFQVPETVSISMDPFCRYDLKYAGNDPEIREGFLLWEAKKFRESLNNTNYKPPSPGKSVSTETQGSSDSSEDEEEDASNDNMAEDSDGEQEICEYIKSQKSKKKQGLDITGETLWYDEEHDVIRNLHKKSNSLTNYGALADQKFFGNAQALFDQLSLEEKSMLKARSKEGAIKLTSLMLQEKSDKETLAGGDFF